MYTKINFSLFWQNFQIFSIFLFNKMWKIFLRRYANRRKQYVKT